MPQLNSILGVVLQVVFEGTIGRSFSSDMAIDDVRLEPNCPPLGITKRNACVLAICVLCDCVRCGTAYRMHSVKVLKE